MQVTPKISKGLLRLKKIIVQGKGKYVGIDLGAYNIKITKEIIDYVEERGWCIENGYLMFQSKV